MNRTLAIFLLLALLSSLSAACSVPGYNLAGIIGQTNTFVFAHDPLDNPLTVEFSICGSVNDKCGLNLNPPLVKCADAASGCCGACQHWVVDEGLNGACLGIDMTKAVPGADGKSVDITYENGDEVVNDGGENNGRLVVVHVACGGTSHLQGLTFVQPDPNAPPPAPGAPYEYHITAESSLLCLKVGMSVGSWLLIILAAIAVIYVIGGVIFNKVKLEKNGLELLPNWDFWKEAPFYARDGVQFVVAKIKEKISGSGYGSI